MKNVFITVVIVFSLIVFSCKKDDVSENFSNLTSHTWVSDSLLVGGRDAGGPGGMLEIFNGEVIFNEDGTGTFGDFEGNWYFAEVETKIVLSSDSLAVPLTTNIEELTSASLKVTTAFPNPIDATSPIAIRLTFKAK